FAAQRWPRGPAAERPGDLFQPREQGVRIRLFDDGPSLEPPLGPADDRLKQLARRVRLDATTPWVIHRLCRAARSEQLEAPDRTRPIGKLICVAGGHLRLASNSGEWLAPPHRLRSATPGVSRSTSVKIAVGGGRQTCHPSSIQPMTRP